MANDTGFANCKKEKHVFFKIYKNMCRIKYSELPLKEGEVPADNNHRYVQTADDVIEIKYCPHCKQWHPLTNFMKCSSTSDGLQSWCRTCQNEYSRQRNSLKKLSIRDDEESMGPAEQEQIVETNCYEEAMDLLSSMWLSNEELQQEIRRLKEEIKSLKFKEINLNSLSERDIECVLKSNKIAPRLLFEAIARIDDRYSFYAIDNVTGMTCPIKIERAVA